MHLILLLRPILLKSSIKSFTKLLQNGHFDDISLNKVSNNVYKYPQFKEQCFILSKWLISVKTRSFSDHLQCEICRIRNEYFPWSWPLSDGKIQVNLWKCLWVLFIIINAKVWFAILIVIGSRCVWVIRGAPGSIVRLTWLSFSLENHADCVFDYVDVFDNNTIAYSNNNNLNLIGRYLLTYLPKTCFSSI